MNQEGVNEPAAFWQSSFIQIQPESWICFFFLFCFIFFSFLKERVETFVFPLDQFLTSYSNYFKPLSPFFPSPVGLKFWYLPWPFSNFKTESTRAFKGSFKIASYLQVWYMRFDTVVIPELIGGDTNLQKFGFFIEYLCGTTSITGKVH